MEGTVALLGPPPPVLSRGQALCVKFRGSLQSKATAALGGGLHGISDSSPGKPFHGDIVRQVAVTEYWQFWILCVLLEQTVPQFCQHCNLLF